MATPVGLPGGTFTFRSVRSGSPFSSTIAASVRAKAAAGVKSASARAASEIAIDGTPKNVALARRRPRCPE